MRFESIHVSRYGCLADLTTGEGALPPIVLVLGPNESGKSTFFSFLTTVLYGFHPATRSRHPYTPWSGGDADGRALIRLDDGTTQEVHRRLQSTGWGRLKTDRGAENIRNQPLPAVGHVTGAVFRQVYALTLTELASLEGESWELVQDRLVGAMGVPDLRPARSVAAEFEEEAKRLWRPDRRGRPRARVLLSELGTLNERRREALALDGLLREKVAEKAAAEESLLANREERERERERRGVLEYRLNRLLPVRRTLARIDELRVRAGSVEELDALPRDPVGRLDELRLRHREVGVRIEELDREAAACREGVRGYEPGHQDMVEAEAEVRSAANRMEGLEELTRDVEAAEREAEELRLRCSNRGGILFSVPWDEVKGDQLSAIPAGELRERVLAYQDSRGKRRVTQESRRGDSPSDLPVALRPGRGRLGVGLGALIAGVALAMLASFFPEVLRLGTSVPLDAVTAMRGGAVLAIVGFMILVIWTDTVRRSGQYRREAADARRRWNQQIAGLESEEETARGRVSELLGELPIRASLLASPGLDLPDGIERMVELRADLEERDRVLADRRVRLAAAKDEIQRLGVTTAVPVRGDSRLDAAALVQSLEAALNAREVALVAERGLARVEGAAARAERDRDAAAAQLRAFEEQLRSFGAEDADRGAEAAVRRLGARHRADQLRDELEREYPALDAVVEEIRDAEAAGETWESLRGTLEEALAHRAELTGHAEELQGAIGRLETEIRHLEEEETADRIEGRIGVLKDRIREAKERRDRAFLLARLVREADRRFRDEHQPDLLLRASGHLRHITTGRYDRIELGETGDESFYLRGPSEPRPKRVGDPLSQGTKEQVYLALRLAIIDHLDAGEERLPLFMDEVLVNWDAWRRDRAFGLLERVAEERQVFLFTCHPAMAAEMEDRGARIITLGEG